MMLNLLRYITLNGMPSNYSERKCMLFTLLHGIRVVRGIIKTKREEKVMQPLTEWNHHSLMDNPPFKTPASNHTMWKYQSKWQRSCHGHAGARNTHGRNKRRGRGNAPLAPRQRSNEPWTTPELQMGHKAHTASVIKTEGGRVFNRQR